jgi:hypothetical protein
MARLSFRLAGGLALLTLTASAPPSEPLRCALALLPESATRELAGRYERDGANADFDGAIPQQVYEAIAYGCVDAEAADAQSRAERLGQAIMAIQLRDVAQDHLARRHRVSAASLTRLWAELTQDQRARLGALDSGEDVAQSEFIVEMALRLRPDLEPMLRRADPSVSPDGDALNLVEDVAIYASSRAILERIEQAE